MKKLIALVVLLSLTRAYAVDAIPKGFDPHHVPLITYGNYPSSFLKPGTGTIEGTTKIKTQLFGELAYGNQEVFAMPNSQFSAWYIEDVAYIMENPYEKDAIKNYPTDLVKFTRTVKADENGNFVFRNLPDGDYIVWSYLEHEVDSNPIRHRSQLAMGADGTMVSLPTNRKGLKIRTDNVVIAATTTIQAASGKPGSRITYFDLLGEFTCCSAEL